MGKAELRNPENERKPCHRCDGSGRHSVFSKEGKPLPGLVVCSLCDGTGRRRLTEDERLEMVEEDTAALYNELAGEYRRAGFFGKFVIRRVALPFLAWLHHRAKRKGWC